MNKFENIPLLDVEIVNGKAVESTIIDAFRAHAKCAKAPDNVFLFLDELKESVRKLDGEVFPLLAALMEFFFDVQEGVDEIKNKPKSERRGKHLFIKDGDSLTEVKKGRVH